MAIRAHDKKEFELFGKDANLNLKDDLENTLTMDIPEVKRRKSTSVSFDPSP
jgi:hypothetical protein